MKRKDASHWMDEIKMEKDQFEKYNCSMIVNQNTLPSDAKIMSTTWEMKQKASGQLPRCLNAQGYKPLERQQYYADLIAVPVTNPNTI